MTSLDMGIPAFPGKVRAKVTPAFTIGWLGLAQSRREQSARPLFRGAQVAGENEIAAAAQRPQIVGVRGIVGMTDEIGDRRIAQHAPAVRQRRATETQYLSVGE